MVIKEIFLSLQGEGKDTGLPTIFIRTGRCNLKCKYCDTDFDNGIDMTIQQVMEKVISYRVKRISITGGEPLMEPDLHDLVKQLVKKRYHISIETNGTLPIDEYYGKCSLNIDVKTPCSGMEGKFREENFQFLDGTDQVKFIIGSREDYLYAKKTLKLYPICGEVVFQPIWSESMKLAKELAGWFIKDKIEARLSIQTHKIIGLR